MRLRWYSPSLPDPKNRSRETRITAILIWSLAPSLTLTHPAFFDFSGSILGVNEDKIHCTGGQSWDSCHVTRSYGSGVLPITTNPTTLACERVKIGGRVKRAGASAYTLTRGRKYPE